MLFLTLLIFEQMKLIKLQRFTNEEKDTVDFYLSPNKIVGMEAMPEGGSFIITNKDNFGVSETPEEVLAQIKDN